MERRLVWYQVLHHGQKQKSSHMVYSYFSLKLICTASYLYLLLIFHQQFNLWSSYNTIYSLLNSSRILSSDKVEKSQTNTKLVLPHFTLTSNFRNWVTTPWFCIHQCCLNSRHLKNKIQKILNDSKRRLKTMQCLNIDCKYKKY